MVKHLKENEFDSEVIKADGVSIVDFGLTGVVLAR